MLNKTKATRSARRTVLLVCEGKTDLAFLGYLRAVLCSDRPGGPKVSLRQAHGKGADNVADTLIGLARQAAYDRLVLLADGDIPLTSAKMKALKKIKAEPIIVQPCLEGLLLNILGLPAPNSSPACKVLLQKQGVLSVADVECLAKYWPLTCLHTRREQIPVLDALMRCFE